jgi:hypothetical protein
MPVLILVLKTAGSYCSLPLESQLPPKSDYPEITTPQGTTHRPHSERNPATEAPSQGRSHMENHHVI